MFRKGQSGNPRGCPKGKANGGRPPDWLKEKCRGLIFSKKLIERLASIAAGELVDTTTTIDGRIIQVPAPMQAQVKAAQELLDRGFGKSIQGIELDGKDGQPLTIQLVKYDNSNPV